jgi:hypothetical protein
MNTPQLKGARTWLLDAKEKQTIAQADYDAEVELYKQCEQELLDAFNEKVSTERFLEIREMKRLQGKIVRDAHQRLSLAMHIVDLAETEYDMAFSRAALATHDAARVAPPAAPFSATTSR